MYGADLAVSSTLFKCNASKGDGGVVSDPITTIISAMNLLETKV